MNSNRMKYSNSTSSLPTSYFSDFVLVKCPKCGGHGTITTDLGRSIIPKPYHFVSNFICHSCMHSSTLNTKDKDGVLGTYKGFREKHCPNCQTTFFVVTEPTEHWYRDIEAVCPSCHKTNTVTLHWREYRDSRAIDPFLGYELLLKTSFKNDVLWFYNFEHLDFVRDYINSKLRYDNDRHKYSLISNLPKFLLMAKNRDTINDRLRKLETQFRTKEKTRPTT